jgi:hypothetical protein
MSVAHSLQQSTLATVPDDIETPTAKLVYLALDASGSATVDDLQATLDMKKLVLFETLDTLKAKGLAASDDQRWSTA